MWKDPIVEEIHAVREEIARRFNYDMDAIVAYFKEREKANAHRVITEEELKQRRAGLHDQEPESEAAANPVADEPAARHG